MIDPALSAPSGTPPPVAAPAPESGSAPHADEHNQPGLGPLVEEVRQLAADARTMAEAELAYQKSRAVVVGGAAKSIAIYGALAAALTFYALGALVVGLLLALTPLVTAWGATAIVVGLLALGAFVCVKAITTRLAHTRAALADKDEGPAA